MNTMVSRLSNAVRNVIDEWNVHWFEKRTTAQAGLIRVVMGAWCCLFTASWFKELPRVIGSGGLFGNEFTRFLIGNGIEGTGSSGRLSILYYVQSDLAVYVYLAATCLVAFLLTLGLGGRIVALINAILILGIAHRIPMLQGPGELLITGMLLYLIIDPGKKSNYLRVGLHDQQLRSSANLMVRLVQAHTLLWLSVGFLSSVAETMWWNGTALWWLAIAERSPVWNAASLSDNPHLVSWLSHAYLGVLGLTIIGLVKRTWRPIGLLAGGLLAILTFLFAGDGWLSLAILTGLTSFIEFESSSNQGPSAARTDVAEALSQKREAGRMASGKARQPRKASTPMR
jgi:hypothetical protein